LFFTLRRKIGHLGGRRILYSFLRILLASLVMAGVCFSVYNYLTPSADNLSGRIFSLFFTISCGVLTFIVASVIFRVSEMRELIQWIFKK